jgi:hypothetical protein
MLPQQRQIQHGWQLRQQQREYENKKLTDEIESDLKEFEAQYQSEEAEQTAASEVPQSLRTESEKKGARGA